MNFLKNNTRFSLTLGGVPLSEQKYTVEHKENGCELTTVYTFACGLKITNIAKKYESFDAYEWVSWLENTSKENTEIISELCDGDFELALGEIKQKARSPWIPDPDELLKIYNPCGSNWSKNEFSSFPEELSGDRFVNCIRAGEERSFRAAGGRSSGGVNAPFFNIHNNGVGAVVAIGWTGQWNCKIQAKCDTVRVQTKIEDTHFVLLPGEKIRTSSVVVMNYTGDFFDGQNKWRRLVKEEFSVITKRGGKGPFCAGIWGGMTSDRVIERVDILSENGIPVEYIWMDAGWYGETTQPTLSEYEGDWAEHTGDWTISPHIHPLGMKDITARIREVGKKFILWFEPERIRKNAPIVKEHPEYLISLENTNNVLLNLGNEEAFNYIHGLLSSYIREIGINCYRQDFNFEPLPYWRSADSETRRGITEIKHVMGLYRLWDALLEEFPELIIDNCASGGRRLDIETLKRSLPLWRSDAQCPANPIPEMTQMHTMNFALWMPYHGSGSGRVYDTYRFRSAFSPSMTTNYTFSASDTFGDDKEKLEWFRKMGEEYLSVRQYFSCDVYHLCVPDVSVGSWNAAQWNRPEQNDGMIQIFKHSRSPFNTASFKLRGIDPEKNYLIRDIYGGERTVSGQVLCTEGLTVTLTEGNTAKIYIYKQI